MGRKRDLGEDGNAGIYLLAAYPPVMRVVTTFPAATELVAALGVEPVGVSHECDLPRAVGDLPAITRSPIDADASAAEIDRQVQSATDATGGGSLYELDAGAVERLDPDLVVTQDVCGVCAVDRSAIDRLVDRIDAGPAVVTVDPDSLSAVFEALSRLGRLLDREERAASLVADLESRIDAVRSRATRAGAADVPRVTVLDWTDPVMVAGHWVPELVTIAGGRYELADPGDDSRPREWSDLLTADPDVLIVAPCGFELERATDALAELAEREGFDRLAAVRGGRVWAMDGHHHVNRPGPRLVDTLEALEAIVSPERVESGPPTDVAVRRES